ncbi:hypothetical protein SAMN04488692_12117 [Halarsenatibacter silvermanii]|uniref:Uncharacterized protein n=1 Tax=Halarsenatibacter silvermanii TaxID=321763 RepID=A0A1G9RAM7_9FIRM|nr:hypothetical protein SAMN04488692_12117 [Halarsenatibacter silvermanii]
MWPILKGCDYYKLDPAVGHDFSTLEVEIELDDEKLM